MLVNEIFSSIEGEGIRQGMLCSFVRFYGCKLHCSYCDTHYACEDNSYINMTPLEIISKLDSFNVPYVTITGGEPLQQNEIDVFVNLLLSRGYKINIETNGNIDYTQFWSNSFRNNNRDQFFLTVDYKGPSSLMEKMMNEQCFLNLQSQDVLKFVVSDLTDLEKMREIIEKYDPLSNIFVSSVFTKIQPSVIVEYLQKYNLSKVRIQLQIHKYIWDPSLRGV